MSEKTIPEEFTGNLDVVGKNLEIGTRWNEFNGLIDEVAIYNRALTAEEILGHYNKAVLESKPPAKPVVSDPPSLTASSPITLAGTKEADTSLWLNGRKQVALGPETEWQAEASLEYGPNLISLVAKNEYVIESDPVIFTVTMDDVAPEVTSTSPGEGSLTNNRDLDLSFRLQDEHSPLDLNASIAKASVIDSLGNPIAGAWSVTGTETVAYDPEAPLADGSYVATIHPTDSLGNMTVANLTFSVDGTAPPVPTIDPIDGPVSSKVTVSGTRSSDASSIVVTSPGGSPGAVSYPSGTTWKVTLTGLMEGQTTVSAWGRDDAGNLSDAAQIVLNVDTTAPSAPTVNEVDSPLASTTVTLSGSKEADSRLFVDGSEYSDLFSQTSWGTSVSLDEGSNTFSVFARDIAGNQSGSTTVTVICDTTAPVIGSSTPADSSVTAEADSISITLSDQYSDVDLVASLAGALVKDANKTSVAGSWTMVDGTLVFTSDTALGEGAYTVLLNPVDSLGNTGTVPLSFTLDSSAPSVESLTMSPDSPHKAEKVDFTLTFSEAMNTGAAPVVALEQERLLADAHFEPAGAWLDATTWRGSYTFTADTGDGEYTVTAAGARDIAGNEMAEQAVGSFVLDTEAPEAPLVNGVTTPTRLATQAVTGTKPADTALAVNGTVKVALGPETEWSINYPLREGGNTLNIAARDAAGNDSAAATASIDLDTTPPLFTVDVYQAQAAEATQTISGGKEPGCTVTLNGETIIGVEDLSDTWSHEVTLPAGVVTRHVFAAADALGNTTTRTIDLVYDAEAPPALAEGVLQADGEGRGTEVHLSWPAYPEPQDLAYYRVYASETDFTDISGLTAVGTAERGSASFTAAGLTEGGTYYFAVEPVDTSGNSETAVHTATAVPVDTAAPEEVSDLMARAAYSVAEGSSVTLDWTASIDSKGDLAEQVLYVDAGSGYDSGAVLDKGLTSHTVGTLEEAAEYKFKIAVRDDAGHESAGRTVQAVTRLANPASLNAEPGKNLVSLSWEPVASSHLSHYKVYRLQSGEAQSDVSGMAAIAAQDGTGYLDSGLINGVTYQYAVTAVNTSGAENTVFDSVAGKPRQDADGPVIGTFSLADGQVVSAPLTIEAAASDAESAMEKVEIYIDDVLAASANGESVNTYWNVVEASDGNHAIKVVATDALGNVTEETRTVVVSLAPPATPAITAHVTEATDPATVIGASGNAPLHTTVTLKLNGAVVGQTQATDSGTFGFSGLELVEGENLLSARTNHRGGDSPYSAAYKVAVDTGAPPAPTALAPTALAGGSVQFIWQAGVGETPSGYNLYAATEPFTALGDAGVSQVNSSEMGYTFKEIIPADDAVRYYAVTALDAADNESAASNVVEIAVDRSAPTVDEVVFTQNSNIITQDAPVGPGTIAVALSVSEPLAEKPFFSLEPQEGSPIVVSLTKVDDLHYDGSFKVDATSPHGALTWKFSGKDAIGNRGSAQGAGPLLDVRGPVATVTAPVQLVQLGAAVDVAVTFDEAPVGTPEIEFTDAAGTSVPVVGLAQDGDAMHFSGGVDLSVLAEGEGSFRLVEARDGFGNLGTTVDGGKKLLLYADAPPAPAVPQNLAASAQQGGAIVLEWDAVTGASSYNLYRQGDGESNWQLIGNVADVSHTDLPDADGLYSYAVASVGLLQSESEKSASVSAVSDRTAPAAPTGLALSLEGAGVKAQWQGVQVAGSNEVEVPSSYRLYRAGSSITDVSGLSAVATSELLEAVDASPSTGQRHYAVTALDALGNESAPSASVEIDFPVAPVKNLVLTQIEGSKPQLTWQPADSGVVGYWIYRNGQKVNADLTPGTSFTDAYYAGGTVSYGIAAVDQYGNVSPVREATLPELSMALPEGTTLRRGLLETFPVVLSSGDATSVKTLKLKVGSSAESLLPGPFAVTPDEPLTVQKVAATPLDALDTVAVIGTAELRPDSGATVRITRTMTAAVAGSGTALEIFNEPLVRGTEASVRLKVNNLGSARMDFLTSENNGPTSEVTVYLKDQDGNVLAQGRLDQRTGSQVVNSGGYATARIEPGDSFLSDPITFKVPQSAPYAVVLEAVIGDTWYHYQWPDQVKAPGMRQSLDVTINEVSYSVTAQADREIYYQGEKALVTGHATSSVTGEPMGNVPVRLGLSVKGFDRFYTLTTDPEGDFSFTYSPGSGSAGTFSIWASHPDLEGRSVQDTFNIIGMKLDQSVINLKLAKGTYFDIPLELQNLGNVPLTDLKIDVTASSGISANFMGGEQNTYDLAGGEQRRLTFRIGSTESSPDTGFVTATITTAEGLSAKLIVNVALANSYPVIRTNPSYIDAGLVRGTQKVQTFTIGNVGLGSLDNGRLEGPSTSWMSLTVDPNIGSLAVGQKTSVGVLLRPDASVPPGVYNDRIVIQSDNHIPYTFNIQATVTSDAVGNVQFDVLNELYEDVAGASITLQHQSLPELYYTLKTGADGTVSIFDIPEGRYSYMVNATGHKSYSGSLVVQPGLTLTMPVALEVTLVEVEWSVTEITIEDRYEIKIEQTFETNVPTAVIVVDPPAIIVPKMEPGDVFNGEVRITNHGLISAKFLGMDFPSTIGSDIDVEVLNTIPDRLGANQTVVVPYRLTRREQ